MMVAACGPASGPAPAVSAGPQGAVVGASAPSIPSLLSQRERLALTSPQVIALDSVARVWRIENDTLARRLRQVWGDRPDPRARQSERARELMAARPTLAALVENNRRMTGSVEAILNPAQQQIACQIQNEDHSGAHGGRRSSRPRNGPRWPWCAITRPDTASASPG
jgi:hypothetical protein